jgi:hypothetical protein
MFSEKASSKEPLHGWVYFSASALPPASELRLCVVNEKSCPMNRIRLPDNLEIGRVRDIRDKKICKSTSLKP